MTSSHPDKGAVPDPDPSDPATDLEPLSEPLPELGGGEEVPFKPDDDHDLGLELDEDEALSVEHLESGLEEADVPGLVVTEEDDWATGTEPDDALELADDDFGGDEDEDLTEGSEPEPDDDGFADTLQAWGPAAEDDDGEEGFDDELDDLPESLPPLGEAPEGDLEDEGPHGEDPLSGAGGGQVGAGRSLV